MQRNYEDRVREVEHGSLTPKNFYINSPWANAKSKVHAQQFGNLRRTAQIKGGKQEYKVLE